MSMKESALSNTTYRKTSHAKSADDGQGWQETETNDILNAFDNCEGRAPTLVVREVFENHSQDSRFRPLGDTCQTVSATYGMGGNNQPLVVEKPQVFDASRRHDYQPFGDVCETVQASYGTGGGNVPMVTEPQCVGNGQLAQARLQDTVGTLNCMHDQQAVLVNERERMEEQNKSVVRRLTPLECERLQGYPDFWTSIGEWTDTKGKKHKEADSNRYKALGNSIALPYWSWMADRMVKQLKADGVENPTMASLFDGIGGFPLVYSRCGCKPVWASEIEEFPIAVTKLRFPEADDERG